MSAEVVTPGWATEVLAILAAGQPVPAEQLAHCTGARHGELLAFLRDDARLLETSTGWVDGLRLADGVAFVHELTAPEQAADTLAADDDLVLWAVLAADGLPLAGGGTVHSRTLPDLPAAMRSRLPAGSGLIGQAIVGPAGWLAGYQPGDLLRVELRDGALTVSTTAVPPYRSEQITPLLAACLAALGQGLERYRNGEVLTPAADLAQVLADLLVTRPYLLADPAPPLGARLHAAGWETFGGRVGFAGTAWDIGPLRRLDRGDAVAATAALGMLLTHDRARPDDDDDDTTIRTLHQALAIPQILGYLADQVEQRAATAGTRFGPVLDRLTATAATPAQRAATALLAARAAEGAGDSAAAHQLITQALTDQPDLQPALLDAVEYAACRGDLRHAENLLRRLDHPVADTLRSAVRSVLDAPAAPGQPGRNQPCPCGSGRKYKTCCQAQAVAPLPARAGLLYTLVSTYAQRPGTGSRLGLLLNQAGSDMAAILLCVDLLLTHDGATERFLHARGAWLRADERHLITSWTTIGIGAFEIRDVRPGLGATARLLPSREQVMLHDRKLSTGVRPRDLYCGRILTNGNRPQLLSMPVLITRDRRRDLLDLLAGEPSAEQIAAFVGPQPPAHLQNSDGHEYVDAEVVLEVTDPAGQSWQRLTELLERIAPDILEHHTDRGVKTISIGRIHRTGRRWVLTANSRERLAAFEALVRAEAPTATEVSRRAERLGGPPPAAGHKVRILVVDNNVLPADIPDIPRAASESWLNTTINALGMTPRQAATADSDTRTELEAILDDIQWHNDRNREHGKPPTMDIAWTRDQLGI